MYVSSMLHLSENLPDQIAQLLSINNKHYNIAGTCAVMGPHTQKMQGGPHIIVFVIATAYKCVQKKTELSYHKQIVRKLRTQYVENIYNDPVTLNARLKVTQGH